MRRTQLLLCALFLAATALPRNAVGADSIRIIAPGLYTNAEQRRLWKPVADDVYFQEVGGQVRTAQPVTALAAYQGTLYAVTGGALKMLNQQALQDVPGRRRGSGGCVRWAGRFGRRRKAATIASPRTSGSALTSGL